MSHYGYIVLLILVTLGCSSNNTTNVEENVLAQINDHSVSIVHFENAFKEYYYRTGQVLAPTESTKRAILDSEFNTYVLAVYAKDQGLERRVDAEYRKMAIERRVLTEEYLNQVILAEVHVSEEDLRDFFLRFNSSLRASHIYANTKEEADRYYERIQNGETFDELAKEAFKNVYMAENGGDIGRFTTDELDIAFENQAFSMNVGDISEPIKTSQGYSIIKLTDRSIRPIITEYEFAQSKNRVQAYARKKLEETTQREHLVRFSVEGVIDEGNLKKLADLFLSSKVSMLSKQPEFLSTLFQESGDLLLYGNFNFDVESFYNEYLASTLAMLNTIEDESSFKNFLVGVAYRAYMVSSAKELEIDKQEEVKASIEETYLHYLEDVAVGELRSSIVNTPAELYNTFVQERDRFIENAKVRVQRLVIRGEDEANEFYQQLGEGADFTQIVVEHTIKNEDIFTNGDLGYVPVQEFGFNSPKIAALEIGELTEVVNYAADEYHIYKLLDKINARPLTFDEAKEMVDDYLTKMKLQTLRAETIEKVKKKHKAIIDIEKLNALTIKI